jgi:Smg protein
MFELLIYMFENYLSSKSYIDYNNISLELKAAGFENEDIEDAFDWFLPIKGHVR